MAPEPPITRLAAHYGPATNLPVNVIVIHCAQAPETPHTAEAVADYDDNPTTLYAAHYAVDSDSVQHMVPEANIGFHAPPNIHTIGFEQPGYAEWTPEQWQTADSRKTRVLLAEAVRECAERHNIPLEWLTPADLKAGRRGITSHWNRTLAFGQSTHTDPGPNYPYAELMELIQGEDEVVDYDRIQAMLNVVAANIVTTVVAHVDAASLSATLAPDIVKALADALAT